MEPKEEEPAGFDDETVLSDQVAVGDSAVFVDQSGRRRRRWKTLGIVLSMLCVGYAVLLGFSFAGGPISPRSLLLVPVEDTTPASGQEDDSVAPSGSPTAPLAERRNTQLRASGKPRAATPSASAPTKPATSPVPPAPRVSAAPPSPPASPRPPDTSPPAPPPSSPAPDLPPTSEPPADAE